MRKIVALLSLIVATTPAVAPATDAMPAGATDPLGSLRWLPRGANERPQGHSSRLVVVYDRSLDDGGVVPLRAKGPFVVGLSTTTVGQMTIAGHSPSVSVARGDTGSPEAEFVLHAVDGYLGAWTGDIRDGDCAKAGTGAFSAAYSTTRSFFHPGAAPYAPSTTAGGCEVVDAATAVRDSAGRHLGFDTIVTTHVPGFWIDVFYSELSTATFRPGRANADIWYEAAYDEEGEEGLWHEVADAAGISTAVDAPYDQILTFRATPGGTATPCLSLTDPTLPGSFGERSVHVPVGTSSVTFQLFPKGSWEMRVIDPSGQFRSGLAVPGRRQVISAPGSGTFDFPVLRPGWFTVRACNIAGEHEVVAAVTFG
ncbi:MAG TPA: hypothetical protein VM638_07175 [Actinomycetota bacterium]|nr:hypothetical protein [Actinomycetota bacterium]